MELNEKILALRKEKGWTQEELAEALYVSRTAISKWESGRGYPSIDSLKAIAKLFCVSVDELLSGEELITVAETDAKEQAHKSHALVFGLVDCMVGLLLFLPFFGEQIADGKYITVSLMQLSGIVPFMKIMYTVSVVLSVIFGVLQLAFQNAENRFWIKNQTFVSLLISVIGLLGFILSNQPYAGAFLLFIIIIKGFFAIKAR